MTGVLSAKSILETANHAELAWTTTRTTAAGSTTSPARRHPGQRPTFAPAAAGENRDDTDQTLRLLRGAFGTSGRAVQFGDRLPDGEGGLAVGAMVIVNGHFKPPAAWPVNKKSRERLRAARPLRLVGMADLVIWLRRFPGVTVAAQHRISTGFPPRQLDRLCRIYRGLSVRKVVIVCRENHDNLSTLSVGKFPTDKINVSYG